MALIIYHNADLDGICSAAVLHRKFPGARLYGHQYGDEFIVEEAFEEGEMVIMADVSMPMDVMERIALRSGDFYWIDHHVSAFNEFKSHFNEFKSHFNDFRTHRDGSHSACDMELMYIYDQNRAACELCWEYVSDGPMPEAVLLLGEYDTWRGNGTERWDSVILPFQYGMRLEGFTPQSLAGYLDSPRNHEKILEGRCVLKYQRQQDILLMEKSFDARLNLPSDQGALRCLVCNGASSSTAFESKWDEDRYDVMVGIRFDGKKWSVGLRTTKEIDVSAIAKSFGGGGHKKAAGCAVDNLRKLLVW